MNWPALVTWLALIALLCLLGYLFVGTTTAVLAGLAVGLFLFLLGQAFG